MDPRPVHRSLQGPMLRGALAAPPEAGGCRREPATLAQLVDLPLLATLDEAALSALAQQAWVARVERGDRLVLQGERIDLLGVLLSGRAHARRLGQGGRELLLDVLTRGDTVGGLSLIDGEAETATVRATTAMELMVLPGSVMLAWLARSPELAQAMTQALIRRLRRANRRIASLALHHVRERLVWHLTDMGRLDTDGRWRIDHRVNRTELSLLIGASREMVSRAMSTLAADGVLQPQPDGGLIIEPEEPGRRDAIGLLA